MTTRLFTIGIAFSLLAIVAGNWLLDTPATSETGNKLLTYGAEGARLLAWGMLISGGTILGTRYFRLIMLLSGLLLVGVLFRIQHLPGANNLLWISFIGIALTYAVRFLRKAHKGQFDMLKLLLVFASCGSALLLIMRLAPLEVRYLPPCLLGLTVLDFLYLESRKRAAGE
jgi:hypothetical protein